MRNPFSVQFLRIHLGIGLALLSPSLPLIAEDATALKQAAASAFYTSQPFSVRKVGQAEQFLFVVADPSSVDSPIYPGCRLILAQHDKDGIKIIWQYRLSKNQTADNPIWFGYKGDKEKSHIFVYMSDRSCHTFRMSGNSLPIPEKQFSVKSANGVMELDAHQIFIVVTEPKGEPAVFFSWSDLQELNLVSGETKTLFQLPNLADNFMHYLAVEDLNGDGVQEVVGAASLASVTKGKVIRTPEIIRVWHSTPKGLQQIYSSKPQDHWAVESDVAPLGLNKKLTIISSELNVSGENIDLYLHLYRWNGKILQELTTSRGVIPPLRHNGYAIADFKGDGINSILSLGYTVDGKSHLSVSNLVNKKLIQSWISPPMNDRMRFGRVSDYDYFGHQEIPLINTDTGKISLLKQIGNRYVGWEPMRLPAPAAPPPPPALNTRFYLEQRSGIKPADLPRNLLILDDKPLIQVYANTREMNAEYRAQQIQKRIVELAKQKFKPSKIVARKIGDEDEEPKMEVAAGKVVVITLTESEAKAQGKTLTALADDWASAVRLALITLAKPPK